MQHQSNTPLRTGPILPALRAVQLDPRDPFVLTDDPAQQEIRITACEAVDRMVDLLGGHQEAVRCVARYLEYAAAFRGLASPFGGR